MTDDLAEEELLKQLMEQRSKNVLIHVYGKLRNSNKTTTMIQYLTNLDISNVMIQHADTTVDKSEPKQEVKTDESAAIDKKEQLL